MEYKFCPQCGGKLARRYIAQEHHDRLICTECDYIFYLNPKPTAAVVIQQDNKILFVKRKYEPQKGAWSLPAGFVEYDESVHQAGVREVREETNLTIKIKRLLDVHSSFENPDKHVLVVGFEGELIDGELKAGDDAEDVRFFDIDNLPENIAWHCHLHFVNKVIRKKDSSPHHTSK